MPRVSTDQKNRASLSCLYNPEMQLFSFTITDKTLHTNLSLSVLIITMAITATKNDPDIEIITSGRRRIPAHSGILVRIFSFLRSVSLTSLTSNSSSFTIEHFCFFLIGVNYFWFCLKLRNV